MGICHFSGKYLQVYFFLEIIINDENCEVLWLLFKFNILKKVSGFLHKFEPNFYRMFNKIISSLLLIFTICKPGISQLFPKENSTLNYRIVGFSFPAENISDKYTIEIAKGYHITEDSFQNNIITKITSDTSKVIIEVPSFGIYYTWRVHSKKKSGYSELHHFSTGYLPDNSSSTRLRITKKAEKYNDAYVFLDACKVLYDMKGNPVWFLPEINGTTNDTHADLKISPFGSITLILGDHGYEIDYNGKVLWEAPRNGIISGDSIEHFHHQLNMLKNGHYMILGLETAPWDMDGRKGDSAFTIKAKMPFGTVLEYDAKGNLIWSWKSSTYFLNSDVVNYNRNGAKHGVDVHQNSFCFDEINKAVYVSFRGISRIVKIKYPEGTVINSYGEIYKANESEKGNGLFCGQHSCNITHNGNLYLFDNNNCNNDQLPKIQIFQEPGPGLSDLKKIWEYQCKLRNEDIKNPPDYKASTGGNVYELPDNSMFVSMGSVYGEIFIVSPDKKIVWSCFPEKWNMDKNKWELVYQYRSSIIASRTELERLIWNSEK